MRSGKMRVWILVLISVPYTKGQLRETEFECGRHGRFEYCIDGVPGCVVGCHCHPGYYFDTDTKICEPNIKLTQSFRRNNYEVPEPTRVQMPTMPKPTPPTSVDNKPSSPKTAVDEKIDIITKDADDLGDWLYNQFFKTIENQVINETKDESIKTRRSDSAPTIAHVSKPTRRSHKYWRSKKKKKRKGKKGLRSKLLRITEDDSLFDSSSGSTSDDSSSDSSSSSDSDSSREKHSSDHGHKKIVVFNKRPKPPLPSFIFLPNMETPFFPPIGLPPPPMPMYPMVPVPPMMGPFPFPAQTPCNDVSTTDAGTTTSSAPATTKAAQRMQHEATQSADDQENTPEENEAEIEPNEEAPPAEGEKEAPDENSLRLRSKKNRKNHPRNKLVSQDKVQKLRDKLKRKNKLENYFAQNYQHPKMQIMPPPNMEPPEDFQLPMQFQPRQKALPEINEEDEFAKLQDIDFKYLSQLIHRADLNRTSPSPPPPLMFPPSTPVNDHMLSVPPPSRRNYGRYHDQMIGALTNLEKSNLANHPMNLNTENQPLFHSLKQDYISNQPAYNSLDQFSSNQPTFKPQTQLYFGTANQQTYKQPTFFDQRPNNAQNIQTYKTLNKPLFNSLNQPSSNVPGKPVNDAPNISYQASLITPNKPTYNKPVQQSLQSRHREESQVFDQQYTQQLQNFPRQQPPKEPNQASYSVPNRRYYTAPNQPAYSAVNQQGYNVNQPTHVSLNKPWPIVSHRKKIEDTNDTYYSNLGRQIASMIRNIDDDKEVDIEIKANVPGEPFINGNDGSRSYWERYVRSPYKMINSYKKEINHLKNSNENLFSLENKVSLVAFKEPTSLNELENIISKMQQTKQKYSKTDNKRHRHRTAKPSRANFNDNLLPEDEVRLENDEDEMTDWLMPAKISSKKPFEPAADFKMMLYLKSNTSTNLRDPEQKTQVKNVSPPQTPDHDLGSLLTNYMFSLQSPDTALNKTISDKMPKKFPTRKQMNIPPQIVYKMPNHFNSHSYTVEPKPLNPALLQHNEGFQPAFMQATTKRTFYQKIKPMVINHKNLQIYDTGNNNQYMFEKTSIPVQQKPYARIGPINPYAIYGSRVEPSYFHHEVHHFDYFDDLV